MALSIAAPLSSYSLSTGITSPESWDATSKYMVDHWAKGNMAFAHVIEQLALAGATANSAFGVTQCLVMYSALAIVRY